MVAPSTSDEGENVTGNVCEHLTALERPAEPVAEGCVECLAMGDTWFHLRVCAECGHVGCCNDSKNKHAAKHYAATTHPIMRSFEPGEDWWYCFPDDLGFRLEGYGPLRV
jgi:uncharacterized UBP type Zn finger protein